MNEERDFVFQLCFSLLIVNYSSSKTELLTTLHLNRLHAKGDICYVYVLVIENTLV